MARAVPVAPVARAVTVRKADVLPVARAAPEARVVSAAAREGLVVPVVPAGLRCPSR